MKLSKIAFGVALAAGSMAAQADSIFFPYVVNSATVTTVVNVIDTATADANSRYNAAGAIGGNRLHYTLVNKSGAAASENNTICQEVDYFLPSSAFDLQSIDLGAKLSVAADKGVLFNDPGVNNAWKPAVSGSLTYALAAAAAGGGNVRGFLTVDNAVTSGTAQSTLAGEALVFEFANGAAWGYQANGKTTLADNDANEFDYAAFASGATSQGIVSIQDGARVSFLPLNETTTRFFVTPLNVPVGQTAAAATATTVALAAADATNNSLHPTTNPVYYGSFRTQVQLRTGAGVAYDRDENLVSGTVPTNVTCVGAVDVASLLAPGARTVLENGGWGFLQTVTPGNAAVGSLHTASNTIQTNRAVVTKIEFNGAGSTFNGQAFSGTFNNATGL